MAVNEAYVEAPVEAVWAVLCDPYAYPRWVVGTDRTLEADPAWPHPGSAFKVHIALGYSDFTHSRAVEPGKRIVLDAAGGPFGAARIEIELEPDGTGTRLRMQEDPAGFMAPMRWVPPIHWLIRMRNVESLRRFKRLAEAAG